MDGIRDHVSYLVDGASNGMGQIRYCTWKIVVPRSRPPNLPSEQELIGNTTAHCTQQQFQLVYRAYYDTYPLPDGDILGIRGFLRVSDDSSMFGCC